MTSIAQLVEKWEREDPRLAPEEKETTINFAKDEDRATVYTDEAGIGRRLIAHPDSEVEAVFVLNNDRVRRVSVDEVRAGDEPVGVRAKLPIGALSVRSSPRKTSQHAAVVTDRVLTELGEPEAVTDGGRYILPPTGGRVEDRENGDELVVVDIYPETTAAAYTIEAIDATVASVNEKYDPDAPVVEAVYAEEVEAKLDGWRSIEDLRDALAFDAIRSYTFPADRLASISGGVDL